MGSGLKTYWTIGVHPWALYEKLYWVFFIGLIFGAFFSSGEILRYWFEILLALLFVKALLLLFSVKRISIGTSNQIITRSLFKKQIFSKPVRTQTFWSYGGADLGGHTVTHFEPKGTMNDIYIWLELENDVGAKQLFYEVVKMGTKFPNNHRYEYQNINLENAIQVYDVDRFLLFLKKNLPLMELSN